MQYRTRAAKNDSASAYRFYRNAKNLQARRSAPRNDGESRYRLVSRQPAASASSTEQNQRVPLEMCIWIFAYQRLVGL